ncbi:MAG TPA: hypothetical protein VG498_05070 [Terriglobales bacterium]|nr:hypothetical protein [Terriglobales bacterium]
MRPSPTNVAKYVRYLCIALLIVGFSDMAICQCPNDAQLSGVIQLQHELDIGAQAISRQLRNLP